MSLQFVKGRGDSSLTAAVCCSVSDLNLCIPGVERSNKKAAGACGSRFQTFTSSLKNWCSRVWLLAGKRIFFFFFFWHKGIRINTWIKNYAQHPLVWKESNLRLAPLPLDVPRAGQLLTPKGGCVPAPSGSLCSAASTEHTVRTSARPSVTRAAGSSARGPPPYNIISNHQLTFKYFLKLR